MAAGGDAGCGYVGCHLFLFPIYTSADSGVTWTQTSAPNNYWSSVAASADGTKLVGAARGPFGFGGNDSDGLIYTSPDSGVTWTQTSAPSNSWSSVASSPDGTKLVAVISYDRSGSGGPIYTSTDSGATWTQSSALPHRWASVASSADGTKLVAVVGKVAGEYGDGLIYTSTNSGATWMPQSSAPNEYWTAVASSADGSKVVAVASVDGAIYTLQFPIPPPPPQPSPQLSIGASGGSLGVSWLVPSTLFVLQQNIDLGSPNWTDLPTPPTLNFTNLYYQVAVSPSFAAGFYRLKQP